LKRLSGIVWHPRWVAGLLLEKDARRSGNPSPPPPEGKRLPRPHARLITIPTNVEMLLIFDGAVIY